MLNLTWYIASSISFESIFCAEFTNVNVIAFCWTNRFLWWFLIWAVKMTVFDKNIKIWSCDEVLSQQIKCLWRCDKFCLQISFMTTPSGEHRNFSNFFKNFTNDVIMTGSDQTPRNHVWSYSVVDYLAILAENKIVTVSLM